MAAKKKQQFHEHELSRRERQIMGAVYRLGQANIAEIVANIPDPPTSDAIRRLCHILQEKGYLRAFPDGKRKVYAPTVEAGQARQNALTSMIDTFFGGSPHMLVATLLDTQRDRLRLEDIERLSELIDEKKESGS